MNRALRDELARLFELEARDAGDELERRCLVRIARRLRARATSFVVLAGGVLVVAGVAFVARRLAT